MSHKGNSSHRAEAALPPSQKNPLPHLLIENDTQGHLAHKSNQQLHHCPVESSNQHHESGHSPDTPSPLHHWSSFNASHHHHHSPHPSKFQINKRNEQWKRGLRAFFEDPTSSRCASIFHLTQSVLIIISALCLCISTTKSLQNEELLFFFIEAVLSVLFTMEYLCRWVVVGLLDVGQDAKGFLSSGDDYSESGGVSLLGDDLDDSIEMEEHVDKLESARNEEQTNGNGADASSSVEGGSSDPPAGHVHSSSSVAANTPQPCSGTHPLHSTSSPPLQHTRPTFTHHPIRASLRFIFNWWNLIDLAAFLPFWIDAFLFLLGVQVYIEHFAIFRILRLIRIFRIFPFGIRVNLLIKAIRMNLNLLFSVLCMSAMSIVIFGTFIYFAEHSQQPEAFSSIPASLYFVTVSLSTTGYGDYVPKTFLGKIITAFIIAVGAVTLTLPGLIVSTTFASLSYQYDVSRRKKKIAQKMHRDTSKENTRGGAVMRRAGSFGQDASEDTKEFLQSRGSAAMAAPPSPMMMGSASIRAAEAFSSSEYKYASKSQLVALLKEKDSALLSQIHMMQRSMKEIMDTRHLLRATLERIER